MARKLPSHLKIHTEENVSADRAPAGFNIQEMLSAFTEATGWIPRSLHATGIGHGPVATGAELGRYGDADEPTLPLRRRVRLISDAPIDGDLDIDFDAVNSIVPEESAWLLLEQIDALVQQLHETEAAVRTQEAQLATSLGVSIRKDESAILSSRMLEALQRAGEQTGSDAAAVYLLDDTTSQLKMRSCWGMPTSSLNQPPRELRGSLGDLEALMGNAVLLENTTLAKDWSCPENYKAAMCLPIGSPTMPQGTIWLFSDHVRDFSSADIDAAKGAADKILVDIERSVLADEVLKHRSMDRQLDTAGLVQSSRLPSGNQPLHHDYGIAGWTFQSDALGGNFHNWTMNRRGEICAALGSSVSRGAAGALVATSVQTVVETCWNAKHTAAQVLRRANDVLWQAQDGDWRSSLAYLQLHPDSGSIDLALAGSIQGFVIGANGFRMLSGSETPLAAQPDTSFRNQQIYLEGGELLILVSSAVVSGPHCGGFTQDIFLNMLRTWIDEPASDVADNLARQLPLAAGDVAADRSLIVIKRSF